MIGRTNTGGGGAGLNFSIVGATVEPSNPKENMIWVNTSTKVTSWAFGATEPNAPTEGMVWFSTAEKSNVEFNAFRKNALHVYPFSAKQYVGSEWLDVTANSYQGGEWVEWINPGALYWNGDEREELTGGWRIDCGRSGNYTLASGSKNADHIALTVAKKYGSVQAATKNKISLAGFSKLCCEYSGAVVYLQVGSSIAMGDGILRVKCEESEVRSVAKLDISSVTGSYYVAVQKFTSGSSFGTSVVHKVWME